MIIVVTGAFGFIGSNLIKALNKLGHTDIIAVDNLTNSQKVTNLATCQILDYVDKHDFIQEIANGNYDNEVDYVFHQGACSTTTELNGQYMMKNNYEYSCVLLEFTQKNHIPLVYASSAAVYGNKDTFIEDIQHESPLNVYAYSKFLFDQIVRRYLEDGISAPVVGLRYFNVYGNQEQHKGRMASVVLHNFNQYQTTGKVQLFQGCKGYANGEQMRDFIAIDDVIKTNLFFFNNHIKETKELSGIYNCGTGRASTFNELAIATINACRTYAGQIEVTLQEALSQNLIEYIPFPDDLITRYQCWTQADLTAIRAINYTDSCLTVQQGVMRYIHQLLSGGN